MVAHDLGAAARFLQEQQDLQMMTDERLCMWFRSERDSWKAAQPARVEQPRKTWWEPVGLKEASELEAAIQSDPVLWRNGKDRMNAGPEIKRAIEQFFELMRVVRRGPGNRQALEESLTQTIATLEKAPATHKTKENSPLAHRMLETLKDLRERNSRP